MVPNIGLFCLQSIEYVNVAREIQANNAGVFSESKLQRIWQGTSFKKLVLHNIKQYQGRTPSECSMTKAFCQSGIVSSVYYYEPAKARNEKLAEVRSEGAETY